MSTKIKNWITVHDNLDMSSALHMFTTQSIDDIKHKYVAISIGGRMFEPGVNFDNEQFSPKEIFSNKWEVLIPNDDAEDKMHKIRELIKKENCMGVSYAKIDHMDLFDIWRHMYDYVIDDRNPDVLYKLIKHIIENKLYKKH